MSNLSMQERLNCPRSYADEQSQHLLCEMGGVCNGTLYDCCTWDKSFSEMMALMAEKGNGEQIWQKKYVNVKS